MTHRRALRGLVVVLAYAGVLVVLLLGVGRLVAGLARDDVPLLVIGGVIAITGVTGPWSLALRGGSLIPWPGAGPYLPVVRCPDTWE